MLDAFQEGVQTGSINARGSGKRQIQSKLLLEMQSVDRERALTSIKSWAAFAEFSCRQHCTHFNTLEEYLEYRSFDVGQM
jgi:hypothetical protein